MAVGWAFHRTEFFCPPGLDCNPSGLTSSDVAVDSTAEDYGVASGLAKIMHTVVVEVGRVDGGVTGTEGAVRCLQYATLTVVHIISFPACVASTTERSSAVFCTGSLGAIRFPSCCKGLDARGWMAVRQDNVVPRYAIKIAA